MPPTRLLELDDTGGTLVDGFAGLTDGHFTFAAIFQQAGQSSAYLFAKTNGDGDRFFSLYSIPGRAKLAVLYITGDGEQQQAAQFDLAAGVDLTDGELHGAAAHSPAVLAPAN